MLFWLRPSKQIRPPIYSSKVSKLRRRRVIRFAILYFVLLFLFVALLVGPSLVSSPYSSDLILSFQLCCIVCTRNLTCPMLFLRLPNMFRTIYSILARSHSWFNLTTSSTMRPVVFRLFFPPRRLLQRDNEVYELIFHFSIPSSSHGIRESFNFVLPFLPFFFPLSLISSISLTKATIVQNLGELSCLVNDGTSSLHLV